MKSNPVKKRKSARKKSKMREYEKGK